MYIFKYIKQKSQTNMFFWTQITQIWGIGSLSLVINICEIWEICGRKKKETDVSDVSERKDLRLCGKQIIQKANSFEESKLEVN